MSIDVGQAYRTEITVRDPGGSLVNPVSIALSITLPDGTAASAPMIVNDSPGVYHADYVTTQAGLHQLSWTTTGPATARADVFSVVSWLSIIGMAEAKNHLNITSDDDDDELRTFMQACTEIAEDKVGPIVTRSFTDQIYDGGYELVLPRRPVVAVSLVQSVWPGGPSWPAAELLVTRHSGIVRRSFPYPFWWGPWDVTYTAGRADPPERFRQAVRELLRHLWETQRGTDVVPPVPGDEEDTFRTSWGAAFSVPQRVTDMLVDSIEPAI